MENSLQNVIQKAVEDPDFAEQLKREAKAAHQAGSESPEWTKLMENFTSSPETLTGEGSLRGWTTITTVTSFECLTTTTTTGL